MSKDKYPSIFSPQMEANVFIILQIFHATRAVLKIGEYPRIFPSFSWGIFTHVMRLDQSRASENIWWIIIADSLWELRLNLLSSFSSPEPTILLACGRDRELWLEPIFWVCAEYSFRILNQSDLPDLTRCPWIADFRRRSKPECSNSAKGIVASGDENVFSYDKKQKY